MAAKLLLACCKSHRVRGFRPAALGLATGIGAIRATGDNLQNDQATGAAWVFIPAMGLGYSKGKSLSAPARPQIQGKAGQTRCPVMATLR
jgi:hypothetical protein